MSSYCGSAAQQVYMYNNTNTPATLFTAGNNQLVQPNTMMWTCVESDSYHYGKDGGVIRYGQPNTGSTCIYSYDSDGQVRLVKQSYDFNGNVVGCSDDSCDSVGGQFVEPIETAPKNCGSK